MMKKGFVIAAMLCMFAAASVMAEETTEAPAAEAQEEAASVTEETVIEWNDMMEQAFIQSGFDGSVNTIEALGMQLIIPEGMEQRQPTEEEKETDTILVFENEEQDKKIEFVLGPVGPCETLADVMDLMHANYPDVAVTPTRINEYSTLVYGSEATDSMTVLIPAGELGFLRIICHPVTDPEMNKLYTLVAASIQQIKD